MAAQETDWRGWELCKEERGQSVGEVNLHNLSVCTSPPFFSSLETKLRVSPPLSSLGGQRKLHFGSANWFDHREIRFQLSHLLRQLRPGDNPSPRVKTVQESSKNDARDANFNTQKNTFLKM